MKTISDGKFWEAITRSSPMYKPEIIRINISSSFMTRARCKKCGKGPDFYYAILKPYKWKSARHALFYSEITRRWISRMVSSWYLQFSPRFFNELDDFTFKLEDKAYNPILHRTRNSNAPERDNVIEFVGCGCGSTVWAFNDKSTKKRPEITNRKGRYRYPQRFVN